MMGSDEDLNVVASMPDAFFAIKASPCQCWQDACR
jgi:hypothetical protein